MELTYRSSFSQHNAFSQCIKSWYWSNILKVPTISDYTHANAGTCIHKVLDKYYSGEKDINVLKEDFERRWKGFRLDQGVLALKRDAYWGMILNGINLNLPLTSCELKIFYPEVIAYIDGVDSNNDVLIDWKSSTRSEDNEHEYRMQLRMYAWLYHRKFGRLPRKCSIYYLKYNGTKGELSFEFTLEDIQEAEKWFFDIIEKMKYYIANPDKLPPFNRDYFFCPYKSSWDTENAGNIKFTLHINGNHIWLEGYVPELLQKGIEKKFSYELKNAYFIKKARPMANTTVRFWNSHKQILPLGFKDGLLVTLQHYAEHKQVGLDLSIIDHRVVDNTVIPMPEKFLNGVELRNYQKEAVDIYMRKKIGVLRLGTGAGKTEISIECIRRLGCKTLFVTDKIELLKQTKKRIEDVLGIEVGQIGQGIKDTKSVSVCTIQTISKDIKQYSEYLSKVKFVILDECHHIPAKSYVKLSKYLVGTEYRLGLSATPTREDGNQMMIQAITGDIIYNMATDELIKKGFLVPPQINFIQNYMDRELISMWEQECQTGLINETKDFNKYYNRFVVDNEFRNNKVLEIINKNNEKKILVLVKLIRHGEMIQQLIPGSKFLYGGSNKQERKQMFEEFVKSENKVLISTIPIWSEGIDCQSLDLIINAGANVSSIRTIQMLGRTLRLNKEKTTAYYYDFIDETRFFKLASLKRIRTLKKEGHEVLIHNGTR